jgi:CBS domain-containing protein
MRVKDLMKTTASPDSRVKRAASIMLEKGISGLPVVDDRDMLMGVITEGDLLRRKEISPKMYRSGSEDGKQNFAERAAAFVKTHSGKVADVMTKGFIAVEGEATVGRVAALMDERHVKCIPVTREGRLVASSAASTCPG